jgi:hypothetical protein
MMTKLMTKSGIVSLVSKFVKRSKIVVAVAVTLTVTVTVTVNVTVNLAVAVAANMIVTALMVSTHVVPRCVYLNK